eukprot:606302_1
MLELFVDFETELTYYVALSKIEIVSGFGKASGALSVLEMQSGYEMLFEFGTLEMLEKFVEFETELTYYAALSKIEMVWGSGMTSEALSVLETLSGDEMLFEFVM